MGRIVRVDVRDLQPGDVIYRDMGVDTYEVHGDEHIRVDSSDESYTSKIPNDLGEGHVIKEFNSGRDRGGVLLTFEDGETYQYHVIAYSYDEKPSWKWWKPRRYHEMFIAPVWAEIRNGS